MSQGIFRVMLAAAAVSMLVVTAVFGADANKPAAPNPEPNTAEERVRGIVRVVKDANGMIMGVKLISEMEGKKTEYNVVPDRAGREFAKMDGKEVIAKVIKKGDKVKILSYWLPRKPAEKPERKTQE